MNALLEELDQNMCRSFANKAAWVLFDTPNLENKFLTWSFTVTSCMSGFRAISLFDSPMHGTVRLNLLEAGRANL